jgi:hypothetical protein
MTPVAEERGRAEAEKKKLIDQRDRRCAASEPLAISMRRHRKRTSPRAVTNDRLLLLSRTAVYCGVAAVHRSCSFISLAACRLHLIIHVAHWPLFHSDISLCALLLSLDSRSAL